MRKSLALLLALIAAPLFSWRGALEAQIAPFSYELRGGASIPVGAMAGPQAGWAGDVGAGPSFGMDFSYAFRWYSAAYVGFSQHRFRCRPAGCGRSTHLVATGFDAGIRWILGSGAVVPVLRTGAVAYRVEGSAPAAGGGSRAVVSHWSVGGEAGMGLTVHVTQGIVLSPGLRYVRMRPRFRELGDLPIQAIVADVGLILGF